MAVRRRKRKTAPVPVVTIEGEEVRAQLAEGATPTIAVHQLVERLAPRVPDTRGCVLPDGVKAIVPARSGFVLVHQTPPSVFQLRWIARDSAEAYGPEADYRNVRIALPYLIVMAGFEHAPGGLRLGGRNECFFSNVPLDLAGLDTELFYPALLNCSRFPDEQGHPLSWICTQHLSLPDLDPEADGATRLADALRSDLRALLRHLLESGFNLSSEHHELSSWYTASVEAGVDPRIATVEDWEKASAEDPLFVLDVKWLSTQRTAGEIAERMAARGAARSVRTSTDIARIVTHASRRSS